MSASLDELLQTLLSAERAGVQVASASLRECQDPTLRPVLEQILAGEGESCRRLLSCMQHLGLEPNRRLGSSTPRRWPSAICESAWCSSTVASAG